MTVGLYHFLSVSVVLFCLGFFTVITRKNAVGILMGVELILNAANINFVAFWRYGSLANPLVGQVFPVFGIMIAAAEARAVADVRALAADIAIDATQRILTETVEGQKGDELVDEAIREVPGKLN